MTDKRLEAVAKAVFVAVENTWYSPSHPECQRIAQTILRGLDVLDAAQGAGPQQTFPTGQISSLPFGGQYGAGLGTSASYATLDEIWGMPIRVNPAMTPGTVEVHSADQIVRITNLVTDAPSRLPNPAGETIPADQGNARRDGTATGDRPVVPSPTSTDAPSAAAQAFVLKCKGARLHEISDLAREMDAMCKEDVPSAGKLKKRPVAFRVKDHADGWIYFSDEEKADLEGEHTGAVCEGLYVRDGTPLNFADAPSAATTIRSRDLPLSSQAQLLDALDHFMRRPIREQREATVELSNVWRELTERKP